MTLHKGVHVRDGTYDAYVVNEVPRCYGLLEPKGKVVFDIGANIGAFTVWAHQIGAAHIHAFEPLPANYAMLQLNCEHLENVTLYEYAVGVDIGRANLYYVKNGKNPGNTSIHVQRGREVISVATVGFQNSLRVYRPNVLKVDVEGAEYDWLRGDTLPMYVRQVAVELHLTKKEWRNEAAPELANSFHPKYGWETLRAPKLDGGNWQTMGVWRR